MHPHFGHVYAFYIQSRESCIALAEVCGVDAGADVSNDIVSSLQAMAGDMPI